ncbi:MULTISPECIES: helix-turn-helix domain-containing protein [Methylococcus]|uniref:helix-turn-helix domain-containing protein n=1 Tax=Methylococcus TaxID=413 RepID=UPI001C53322F|nr:helix-turn-helix domain-containing protein [Methylococcus capsulatus]QXP89897.1 helix-turn-helix domain-containing protein [Methylococcus capsulatus]
MVSESPSSPGFRAGDLLALSPAERRVLQWLVRQGSASAREVAERFEMPEEEAGIRLDALEKQGFVVTETAAGPTSYRPEFGRSRPARKPPSGIWGKLEGS